MDRILNFPKKNKGKTEKAQETADKERKFTLIY